MTKTTRKKNAEAAFRVVTRRRVLQGGVAAATIAASPAYLRKAVLAQSGPIKIGLARQS